MVGRDLTPGPVGAGKTTVAKDLFPLLPAPPSNIEGDAFRMVGPIYFGEQA